MSSHHENKRWQTVVLWMPRREQRHADTRSVGVLFVGLSFHFADRKSARLGIQLTEKKETRPRTPSVVFGEIEEMSGPRPCSRSRPSSELVPVRLAQEKISWSSKARRLRVS